jgi:hypothetical protein
LKGGIVFVRQGASDRAPAKYPVLATHSGFSALRIEAVMQETFKSFGDVTVICLFQVLKLRISNILFHFLKFGLIRKHVKKGC